MALEGPSRDSLARKGLSRGSPGPLKRLSYAVLCSLRHMQAFEGLSQHTHMQACLPACLPFLHVCLVSATLQPQGPFLKVHSYVLNEALRVRNA